MELTKKNKEKVLLVGWDAAHWDIINDLLTQNKMPHLQSIIENGASGTIETLKPALSPMLWTSIATGKTADKHGILGFIEPDLEKAEPRPVSVTSRQCKAIWNILSQNKYVTNVIGWWPSHPAEPVNGISVSNMFTKKGKGEPLISNVVYPQNRTQEFEKGRVYSEDITLNDLAFFVPKAHTINQDKDKHLHNLAALLANAKSIQNATKKSMIATDWDFTAVYFDVIDQVSHTFMKYYPPQMHGVPQEYYELYNEVVAKMYIYHDEMLGELINLAGDDVTVIVLSDHGFYSNHLRPVRLPNDPASPALEHSSFGVVCISGNQIKHGIKIKGANLLDITPTLLQFFNLPMADDMDGKIMLDIFKNTQQQSTIESWEKIKGESELSFSDSTQNSWYSTAALFQMMELGYIQKFEVDQEKNLKKIVNESNYYLSTVLMAKKKYEEAFLLLNDLIIENKNVLRYSFKYAACMQYMGKQDEAVSFVQELQEIKSRELPPYKIIEALCLSSEGKHSSALDLLLELEKEITHLSALFVMIGNEYYHLSNSEMAIEYFKKAIVIDSQNILALANLINILDDGDLLKRNYCIQLNLLTRNQEPNFINTFDEITNFDFNQDRTVDFRKYQLIIRLFLEQFHKGVKNIN
ncbi:MAG: alkaline phosphatase family protein [Bacteroidia bacterium]|nr:alkaline phosphatase family protein [Bacteroidia bacterium]